jgi:uncharacterized protein
MRDRLPLLAGLVVLALAIGLGSVALAGGIRDRNRDDVITVTGSAKKRITSDYVVWDVSVTSQQATATDAAKELGGWTTRIRAFFKHEGVDPAELTVDPISTETVASSHGVTSFKLTRSFEIRSSRVQAVTAVAEHSSALLAQGIPLAADPPQYIYTKLPSLRPELLATATKDAQRRGRVLVESTGGHLGKLRNVDVGVFQVTSPNSTDVSDYGEYDTSTIDKDVTAVVDVTFALK